MSPSSSYSHHKAVTAGTRAHQKDDAKGQRPLLDVCDLVTRYVVVHGPHLGTGRVMK